MQFYSCLVESTRESWSTRSTNWNSSSAPSQWYSGSYSFDHSDIHSPFHSSIYLSNYLPFILKSIVHFLIHSSSIHSSSIHLSSFYQSSFINFLFLNQFLFINHQSLHSFSIHAIIFISCIHLPFMHSSSIHAFIFHSSILLPFTIPNLEYNEWFWKHWSSIYPGKQGMKSARPGLYDLITFKNVIEKRPVENQHIYSRMIWGECMENLG